jgi:hypothetical protein
MASSECELCAGVEVLKVVLWCLVTHRRIKRGFGLDDDALEDPRRKLIGTLHIVTDLDGDLLVWAAEGRSADPRARRCHNHYRCRPCGFERP